MTIQFPDITESIFFEPGKSDELQAALTEQRNELARLHEQGAAIGIELSSVVADLQLMEEKTEFFAEMVDKTQGVFVPPPEGQGELAIKTLETHVFSKARNTAMVVGLLASPIVLDAVLRVGKFSKVVSKTGRVSRVMKSTKYLKIMKYAKGALYLTAAIELASFVINMIASKKLNDQLRQELKKLKGMVSKANKDFKKLQITLKDATAQRTDMLSQMGAATPEGYVRSMNEALADLGRQKANFDTARRMLQHGIAADVIQSMVGLEADTLALLKRRLEAEQLLAAGTAPAEVATALSLDLDQIATIAVVVEARDALLRGLSEEEVTAQTGIGPGQLDDVDDALDEQLPQHWPQIEGNTPLDDLAAQLILRPEALLDLRRELHGKTQIAAGVDIGAISTALSRPREDIVGWASALPLARENAHKMRSEGIDDINALAAANRLPIALVTA